MHHFLLITFGLLLGCGFYLVYRLSRDKKAASPEIEPPKAGPGSGKTFAVPLGRLLCFERQVRP